MHIRVRQGSLIAPELNITRKDGSRETLPLFTPEAKGTMGDQYEISCDRILGHNKLELIIAIVPGLFQKQRETASWLSVIADYEAFGRSFREPRHFCFKDNKCSFVDPVVDKG